MALPNDLIAPVKQANLKQVVARNIRDLILSGAVKSGQRLDQDSLAASLGVSRLPVREALIILETEGLVENIPRRGVFVASLEPADFMDHFRMYGLLSGMAAARAAKSATPQLIADLERIASQMRSTGDAEEHDRLNFRFHQAINKAGGSRRLTAVLRILASNMPSSFYTRNTEWEFRDRALDEHDEIIDAIRAGDEERASRLMAEHFAHTGAQAVQMLEQAGFWEHD